jgi:hypothetical protein
MGLYFSKSKSNASKKDLQISDVPNPLEEIEKLIHKKSPNPEEAKQVTINELLVKYS